MRLQVGWLPARWLFGLAGLQLAAALALAWWVARGFLLAAGFIVLAYGLHLRQRFVDRNATPSSQ